MKSKYPSDGLTEEEAARRAVEGKGNNTVPEGTRTVKSIVLSHTLTYFNFINLFLGVLIITTGQFNNLLFLGVVICNAVIGIVQELKVKQMIDKLSVVTATRCTVIRDGRRREIGTRELVIDDVVVLRPGEQLACDGLVIGSDGLEVNEALLTGEARPVRKEIGDELLSGSFIAAGTGYQKITRVGSSCYASRLVRKARSRHRASSEMQRTIGRVIKVVSVAIIPIGILLYFSQRSAAGSDSATAIVRTVSGIVGMIPEGLVLLTSVSFIIGVGRLAAKKALVQEMESIEALARVSVLCTDKTGTITTGELQVSEVVPLGEETEEAVSDVMARINAAFSDTNSTQDALIRRFGHTSGWGIEDKIAFSSSRKFRAVSFAGHGAYVLGAPEYLAAGREALLETLSRYSEQGYRVLLLCRTDHISSRDDSIGTTIPLAAIMIADVIKENAIDTFRSFAEAGVAIKVLSGDNPLTVSAIARKAGIEGAENQIDASELPSRPEELRRVIGRYTVFGRVKPEQKQLFVKAWQMNGETVAMVGDGVNDVLAIKDADCGIAMAAGSEAAKQAAHIVLLDSDFASMKDIVAEGRTIIANVERSSSLYLTKTIYSILLCLIFIGLRQTYPWTTLQLGFINICCIGLPSFLLTLEKPDDPPAHGFLQHVLKVAAPSALTMTTMILLVQLLKFLFQWDLPVLGTFDLVIGGLVGLLVVLEVMWPLTKYRKIILTGSLVIFWFAVLLLPGFYDIHSLFMWWSLLLIPLGALTLYLITVYARLMNRLQAPLTARLTALRKKWKKRLR